MNILIVNKYYFISGGPERYMFTITAALEKQGHNIFPLALKVNKNLHSEYSSYFIKSPFGEDVAMLGDAKLNFLDKIKLALTTIYSYRAKRAIKKIIDDKNIDVVYLLNFCNYITPSVIDGAKDLGVPVVMRLSDFNFICSMYHFMRNGSFCRKCKDSTINAIRYRCVRGSFFQSLSRVLAINMHRLMGVYKKVDAFVCPSVLMKNELEQFGMAESKVNYIPSFVDTKKFAPELSDKGYALYYGRLSREKGIDVLINAWQILGVDAPPLRIIGSGDAEDELKQQVIDSGLQNISFSPFLAEGEVREIVDACTFVLIPSVWPDNSPMVAYESMALGKPVIASSIGGLADQVVDGGTGLLVPPGDPVSIADAVRTMCNDPELRDRMGVAARERAVNVFNADNHLASLNKIFSDVV